MSRVTELEKALTTLFRKGTEVGYTETEIDEFLENIDYHALLQAVWNKAETVYAYSLIHCVANFEWHSDFLKRDKRAAPARMNRCGHLKSRSYWRISNSV